jgi:hypothetical protein
MEGIVSLADVKSGVVDIIDLLKLNALLDLKSAVEHREMQRVRSNP